MPKEYPRSHRVAEQLRRELAELIRTEMHDPRLGMVTVSDVEVSKDLGHAKVFVTVMEDAGTGSVDETLGVLNKAAGFFRRELAKRLALRAIPRLRFVYDASLVEGFRLDALIDEAVRSDRDENEDTNDPGGQPGNE